MMVLRITRHFELTIDVEIDIENQTQNSIECKIAIAKEKMMHVGCDRLAGRSNAGFLPGKYKSSSGINVPDKVVLLPFTEPDAKI